MANILLVDPSEVAQLAMRGILQRGRHRLVVVRTGDDAWDFIHRAVKIDLVFSELKVGGNGIAFAQRLKDDRLRRALPFVFYTAHGDRDAVKRALELQVQNFLIKPYHEEAIYTEIAKATARPWRAQLFAEEKSFCEATGLKPDALRQMLEKLRGELTVQRELIIASANLKADKAVHDQLAELSTQAEAVGAVGVVDYLASLGELVVQCRWSELIARLDAIAFADQLIFNHLNPALEPPEFLSATETEFGSTEAARAHWLSAPAENRCPVVTIAKLCTAIDALPSCPVIDSAAAAFQMGASGDPNCISPLMDLVERNPSLSAQVLIAANETKNGADDGTMPIDDPRLAVGLLGEVRLIAQSRALATVAEKEMQSSPEFNWPQYWTFQNGVAQIARFICRSLELPDLESLAYTGGLLHDLGRMFLLRVQPIGFHAVLEHVRTEKISLRQAEKKFLGGTTNELGVHFAEKAGLPRPYINVLRWIDTPALATEHIELVAVVSLARDFCRHNHLGNGGDLPLPRLSAIEQSPEWIILRERVFPGFNLRKFELQVHAECQAAKNALRGTARRALVA